MLLLLLLLLCRLQLASIVVGDDQIKSIVHGMFVS